MPLAVIARRALAIASVVSGLAAASSAQLVPVSRCQAAYPCAIPFGLRPADSLQHFPYARQGQGAAVSVSAGIEDGLKPKLDVRTVSEDPSETAARIFLNRNPRPTPTRTPPPAPR